MGGEIGGTTEEIRLVGSHIARNLEVGVMQAEKIWGKCTDMIFAMYWQIKLSKNQPRHFPDGKVKLSVKCDKRIIYF